MPEPTHHFTRNVTSVFDLLVKAKPVRKPILKVENTHMTHRFHTSPQQNHIKSIHRPVWCKNAIKSYILHQWKVIDTCVSMHFIIYSSLLRLTWVKNWAVWLRTCHLKKKKKKSREALISRAIIPSTGSVCFWRREENDPNIFHMAK